MSLDVAEAARVECLGPPPVFVPVVMGPTWRTDADGDWDLPEHTLGWAVISWCAIWLNGADGERGWTFTDEQARFILWYYAIDENGTWVYRDAILQRVKGWGKDPLAAVICAIELVGPCRFGGWGDEGEPIAVPLKKEPWIQVVGTAREQTKNTFSFLQGIFTKEAKREYDIQVFKEIIYARANTARIEVVTSAPRTMEGNRPSLVVKNEPHHWLTSNDGVEVSKVVKRNVNKMRKTKQSRELSITNAYNPAESSVAQSTREAYEEDIARGRGQRTMYDSLEASETESLLPQYTYLDGRGDRIAAYDAEGVMIPPSEEVIREHLRRLLYELRGDAEWLDPDETAQEIMKPDSDMSEMRRFYLNSVVSGDDAYLADGDIRATVHPLMAPLRAMEHGDILRQGWTLVAEDDPVVLFFDGSKDEDSTGIIGCRVSDGYIFTVGVWEKPPGERGRSWRSPKNEVDARVHEAFKRFNVVAFWGDPSHTKDDQDGTRYWDGLIDGWHMAYQEQLQYWAVQTGDRRSAVMWDMTSPLHQSIFSEAVVRFADEMDLQEIVWDGHPALRTHFRNARRSFGRHGLTVRKPARGGTKKIDLAVCAIGARMLARLVNIKGLEKAAEPGNFWY